MEHDVQMKILHISYECYPFAKVGGMADVVGALPKYQQELGATSSVVMPRYAMDWDRHGKWTEVFHGSFYMDWENIHYDVYLGGPDFKVFTIDIPGKFDRPQIYSYDDDLSRSIAFQRAVLHWLHYDAKAPVFDILHCHDHHTGLIPFMVANCLEFESMRSTPTVFTIHNAAYQGAFSRDSINLLPEFLSTRMGLLEWGKAINPLASALKCSWHFNTVSEGYLRELFDSGHGLEGLIRAESSKASGILNGIDTDVWDPANDPFLPAHKKRSVDVFKRKNKENLCTGFGLDPELPLYVFIGRLAYEKGADMLPSIVGDFAEHFSDIQFVILGSGDSKIEQQLKHLEHFYPTRIKTIIAYNEELAHRLYAACDFLLMPSRVEPCGLNQMYCMRYGGIPIVRNTGGLRDTVQQLNEHGGNGYVFDNLHVHEVRGVLIGSRNLYQRQELMSEVRKRNAAIDFSWQHSAKQYLDTYSTLI